MKKFLIILMVVAMASFFFVGCTTPPIPDEPVVPDEPTSVTPVIKIITNVSSKAKIIDLYSSDTQYVNADEVDGGILVKGFAPKYSEVNVYINGEVVGTSTAYGTLDFFSVFVDEDNLGVDGTKTLYAIATEVALGESAHSTEYAFTLDTVAPEMMKVAADKSEGTVTVTFDEELDKTTGNWTVKNIITGGVASGKTGELISPKVVELEVAFVGGSVGDLIRVTCTSIEDLAGNETTGSFGYCYLEE